MCILLTIITILEITFTAIKVWLFTTLCYRKTKKSKMSMKERGIKHLSFPIGLSFPHCVRAVHKSNTHLVTADSKGHFTKNEHTDIMLYQLVPQLLQVQVHGIIALCNPRMQTTRLLFSRTLTPKTNCSVTNL